MSDPRRPGPPGWDEPPDLEAEPTQVSGPSHVMPRPAPARPMPAPSRPAARPLPAAPSRPAPSTRPPAAPRPMPSRPPSAPPPSFAQPPAQRPAPYAQPPQPMPSQPAPFAQPQQPSPFAQPPAPSSDPFALPPQPMGAAAPEGLRPAAPVGVVKRAAPGAGFGGGKTFAGTIMGTMVFLAKSRSVPLAAKIGGVVILVAAVVATTVVLLQMRSRDQARQALDAALALPDGRGTTRVRELATEGLDDESMVRAIRYLGEQHDAESVSLLTESLDAPLEVQRAAAGALAELGPPAAQPAMTALGELLTAEDAALRSRAAWALARLGDGRGMDALIAAIAAGDAPSLPSYDPSALAELMGHDGLVQALAHTSGTVRQFAAYHLGAVCQPTDEPALVQAAQDADASVGSAAVVTLARCGMSAAPAQVSAMLSRDPSRWNALYSQMHREVGAPGLGMMLPHAPDAGARRALLQEIAQSFDPRAGEVLAAELARSTDASERDRLDAGEALAASSDPRVVEVLEPLLASEDEDHARAAIAVLGHAGDPSQVEARLLSLAASPGLRAAAIDAMTSAGVCSDSAQRTVQRWLTQRQVRSSALRMLGRCHQERASELARREVAVPLTPPITAEQGEYRLAALEVIAAMDPAQAAEVAPALLEQLEDASTDPRIRTAIADALGVVAPEAMRDGVLDRMLDARAPRPVRAAAFRLLRHGIAPASISRLIGFVRGGEDDERTQRAAILIGLASPPESRAELAGLLADERAKRTAALALALGADPAGAEALAALVRGDDTIAPGIARALNEPPWIFGADDTGLHRALGAALANRDAGYGAPFSQLCEALGAPAPEGIGWRTPLERRRALLHDLTQAEDAATRVRAAEALVCTGARSVVLWARSRGERGAAEAQRALSDVRSEEPAAE